MRLRGIVAVANAKLLSLARSPIPLVVCAAFLLLASSLPDVAAPSRVERVRQASSWILSAATALLFLSGLLVPVSGSAPRTRLREGRLLGTRRANLGHGAAGLAFLVFLTGLIALGAWGWMRVRFPDADRLSGEAAVRAVVYRSAPAFALAPGGAWTSGPIAFDRLPPTVQVELAPRLRFREAGAAAATRAGAPRLELSWRTGGGKLRTRTLPVPTQPVVESIELFEPGGGAGQLTIGLALTAGDVELAFEPGSVTVLGVRTALTPGLMRALLVIGCMAAAIAATAQWFSNFVGPLIAVSAALTLLIAVGALRAIAPGAVSAGVWTAIVPDDPVTALRRGHETGWLEVGRALGIAVLAIVVSAAASVQGPERREA